MLFRGHRLDIAGLAGGIAIISGCASAPPPPPPAPAAPAPVEAVPDEPAPIEKVPVETGRDCATAVAECGGGVCLITMKNGCEVPITCDLFISASCRANTTMVEARARKRDTFAPKTDGEMSAEAKCTDGDVIHTEVQELRCE